MLALTRFDGIIADARNIFSFFERAYRYYHPEIVCTTAYYEAHDLYLDAAGSFYEGPEVTQFLNQIVMETSLDKGTQRKTTENELPSLTQCTA